MIKRVKIENFKQFEDEIFELDDSVVLVGPNNSGKTTLLQAIATWSLTFNKWRSHDNGKKRTNGMSLTRGEFLSVPLRHFNLLWINTSTALTKDEKDENAGAGFTPRLIQITLEGTDEANQEWQHTMEIRYSNSDVIYIREVLSGDERPEEVDNIKIVHIPSFSGILVDEPVHTKAYQDWLIGQGKPGDLIRNLLMDVARDETVWKRLEKDIEDLFGYILHKPDVIGRPHILCEYTERESRLKVGGKPPRLDIASAGSGFLQTLLMLAFIHARDNATVLLVDEPDAHSHISLQKQIYDRLREKATANRFQIVIATHSEIIINKTDPKQIISFYQKPRRLGNKDERVGIREALKMLSNVDILQARRGRVLYTESGSDLNILLAWARTLKHRLHGWLSSRDAFHCPINGRDAKDAKQHFFALRASNNDMVGALLLDGDNRKLDKHEVSSKGLEILRWGRYEIESYLVHPDAIKRFIWNQELLIFEQDKAKRAEEKLYALLPPVLLDAPLEEHQLLNEVGISKGIFPEILSEYIPKSEYYRIAQVMLPEEIHPEVTEKLDAIADALNIPKEAPKSKK